MSVKKSLPRLERLPSLADIICPRYPAARVGTHACTLLNSPADVQVIACNYKALNFYFSVFLLALSSSMVYFLLKIKIKIPDHSNKNSITFAKV